MAKQHMKRCSASLIVREMHIKTTMRYQPTLVRMAIIKKSITINAEEGVHCWWESKLVLTLWRTIWKFLKKIQKTKTRITICHSNPIPRHTPGENHNLKRYMHPNVHCSTIYNSQDLEVI